MSRNPELRDWPECLKKLTLEQLEESLAKWERWSQTLGHPQARKGAAKYARDVETEIDSRESEE